MPEIIATTRRIRSSSGGDVVQADITPFLIDHPISADKAFESLRRHLAAGLGDGCRIVASLVAVLAGCAVG